jgi:hypothetical protein
MMSSMVLKAFDLLLLRTRESMPSKLVSSDLVIVILGR